MTNKNWQHEEDIKIEEDREGSQYSHPSYGLISVNCVTGEGNTPLFGSEVGSNTELRVRVHQATVTQNLGKNWYYDDNLICEVSMSPVQYSEMITSPNTQGVPCTIKYTKELGHIKYNPVSSRTLFVENTLNSSVDDLKKGTSTIAKDVREVLSKKGTMKKCDKEKIQSLVSDLERIVNDKLPFYEENLTESIERQKLEARTEMETYITHAINRTGLAALNNPDVVQKLIQGDK